MDIARLNPEFLKFPEDIQQKLVERVIKGDVTLILMTKKEIEEEVVKKIEHELRYADCSQSVHAVEKELQGSLSLMEVVERANRIYPLRGLFDRQVQTLLKKGFPKHAGMSEKEFLSHIIPLKEKLPEIANMDMPEGHIPFIIVVGEKLLSLGKQIPLMEVDGKKGFTTLALSELKTAEGVEIPESMAYLVIDVENRKAMLGKSANEAVEQFKKEELSPMTAEEGVALILQHPEILKGHLIGLPGSRHGDDGVAGLWLSGGRPRLGWVWAGDSGAEWGSASCGSRVR